MKEVDSPLEHESNSKIQKAETKKLFRDKQMEIREGFLSEKNECFLECNLFNQVLRARLTRLPGFLLV